MSNTLKIYCKNLDEYVDISGGETLLDIFRRLEGRMNGLKPVCARVNNKTEDLRYPVFAPKQVEFLGTDSPSGYRCYTRSLCMLLYKALDELYPGARLRIEISLGGGYYCRIFKGPDFSLQLLERLRDKMRELVAADIPFERKERLTSHAIEIFRRQGLNDKVRLLSTTHELYTVYYRLGRLCDSYYGNLVPSTGMLGVFDLVPYKDWFLLMGPDSADPSKLAPGVVADKMYDAFTRYLRFNNVIGVRNVGEVNLAVERGDSARLINVAEAVHTKYISRIADEITERYHRGMSVVLIAGPSSSGKTTFIKRLGVQLMTNLLKPRMISLDDYFVDRVNTPRDASGDYDFESLHALDLETFNRDLNALIRGDEVDLPTYDFASGTRKYTGNRIRLEEGTILLIEGIHGLNPELTKFVDDSKKYHIYVSALTTLAIDDHNWIPTSDNRLLRRIVRDHKYRGVSAVETIRRWPSVRRGEERWIFPYQENADAMFNSSLLFEVAVLKEYALELLKRVPHDVPEYGEAWRLMRFLEPFAPIEPYMIPPTSLLREFVGGSSFSY